MATSGSAPAFYEPVSPALRPLAYRRGPDTEPGFSYVPTASYRIQFGPTFGFAAARKLVPFLRRLGVSHLYSSPIFAARRGSTHGYDVTDPLRLNPDLGSQEEFDALVADLKLHGIGLILDIVPNHMAADTGNRWWEDVLEDGPNSVFAHYFDIDWDAAPAGAGRAVVLPVLGEPLRRVVENGELQLALDERGFFIRYWDHRFPVDLQSYETILSFPECLPAVSTLRQVVAAIGRLPAFAAADRSRFFARQSIKSRLWELYQNDPVVFGCIDRSLEACNGRKGDPASFNRLSLLLSTQHYLLTYWRTGREKVNYRRFFDINELVGIRVEDENVFDATHGYVFRLIREGKIAGLRLDHIDGLYDPANYLRRLEERLSSPGVARKAYVVAEKITIGHETLPADWPVCGTTGYDFLNVANAVFVDGGNMRGIENTYAAFTGVNACFGDLVYEQKKRVIRDLFAGEASRLSVQLRNLAAADPRAYDAGADEFASALEEVTARLTVYRTYVRSAAVAAADRRTIEMACAGAAGPAADFLRRVLLLDFPDWLPAEDRETWLSFVMRWQQFTGPVMAKGMEDTACYIYTGSFP